MSNHRRSEASVARKRPGTAGPPARPQRLRIPESDAPRASRSTPRGGRSWMVSGVCSRSQGHSRRSFSTRAARPASASDIPRSYSSRRRVKTESRDGQPGWERHGRRRRKPIRVVDRRMFTPDGELRPDYQAEEADTPAAAGCPGAAARAVRRRSPPSPRPRPPHREPPAEPRDPGSDFASLVRRLRRRRTRRSACSPDPSRPAPRRRGRAPDDRLAGHAEGKTRGNISFEESDFWPGSLMSCAWPSSK